MRRVQMGQAVTDLACPKCQAPMRTYERSGIHIDQCTECRGIFLDRGELERLIDAEAAAYGNTPNAAAVPQYAYPGYGERHRGREHGEQGHHGKRRRGFLDD